MSEILIAMRKGIPHIIAASNQTKVHIINWDDLEGANDIAGVQSLIQGTVHMYQEPDEIVRKNFQNFIEDYIMDNL